MQQELVPKRKFYTNDLLSGLVVFLVALPLCLGIASASGAPLISGIIAGVIGGIVIGYLSGSHISVSGPAAGLTAIVLTQLDKLEGNYQAFLFCLVLAGFIQLFFGLFRLGTYSNFIPTNVIMGLLVAIGLILIINQLPLLFGIKTEILQQRWSEGTGLYSILIMVLQSLVFLVYSLFYCGIKHL